MSATSDILAARWSAHGSTIYAHLPVGDDIAIVPIAQMVEPADEAIARAILATHHALLDEQASDWLPPGVVLP